MIKDKKTVVIKGISASPGIAYGVARVIYRWEQSIEERTIEESQIENEMSRLDTAVDKTLEELSKYQKTAGSKIGGPVAKIFDSQVLIASDTDFLNKVKNEIKKTRKSAEYIYSMQVENNLLPLQRSRDPYMRQMATDIESVSHRVVRYLTGQDESELSQFSKDCIFVGKLFSPAEVLNLFERDARAIVTAEGSPNSHMALIARSLIIPTVIGVRQVHMKIRSGDKLIVDGEKGQITINPSEDEWSSIKEKGAEFKYLPMTQLKELPDFPLKTKDNIEINVASNINIPGPIDKIISDHKIGVGLYRTEFLYLQQGHFPSEDEQFEVYDSLSKQYYPQELVIRTFDLGSDKFLKDNTAVKENNPALGWRGIRASLGNTRIFRDQIRAILRASKRGNIKILLPMITDLSELKRASGQIKRAMVELRKEKIEFNSKIQTGIMIEVPSAAITADVLASKVDFFSIGTNDLTQYTLATDRDNQKLIGLFNSFHPSVLSLIKHTISAAHNHNIPVTVCGEMAGNPIAIPLLIGMGVDQLSMNPSQLNKASEIISLIDIDKTKIIADNIMKLSNVKEIEKKLTEFIFSL
ncbi:MAG: phosphoenolpyruvate--protein phosphotransferase [candidate division Zixibacteria bacterium]|nr:phosphoenolpyruvate--protein phosphotransferase [candidate division Zixibacteria bacterium]